MSDKPQVEWFTPRTLVRVWGKEIIVAQTPTHLGKILTMRAGTRGGLQYHVKEEAHYLVSGSLKLRFDRGAGTLDERVVMDGAAWRVPPGAVHQEEALTDVVTFEVSDPILDDRVRVEAQYGQIGEAGLPSQSTRAAVGALLALAQAFILRAAECVRWAMQPRL